MNEASTKKLLEDAAKLIGRIGWTSAAQGEVIQRVEEWLKRFEASRKDCGEIQCEACMLTREEMNLIVKSLEVKTQWFASQPSGPRSDVYTAVTIALSEVRNAIKHSLAGQACADEVLAEKQSPDIPIE